MVGCDWVVFDLPHTRHQVPGKLSQSVQLPHGIHTFYEKSRLQVQILEYYLGLYPSDKLIIN